MNHIPLSRTQPRIDMFESVACGATICGDAMDIGLPLQQITHIKRLTDRDGVSDNPNTRQPRPMVDMGQRRIGFLLFLGGRFRSLREGNEGQCGEIEKSDRLHGIAQKRQLRHAFSIA